MDKKDMAAGMKSIVTRPKTTAKNVTIKSDEGKKPAEDRRVISIAYSDYKAIKNYANDNDISITAAVSLIVKSSTII